MKIGFFGGSFNPPSFIHINLASDVLEKYNLDKVIFVPVGDYYEKNTLISSEHRYNMLKLATANTSKLEVEKLAIESKTKLYAIDTFNLIKEKYKSDDVFFIMGSDNFRKMPEWKNYNKLVNEYNIIVIERERKKIRTSDKKNIMAFIPKEVQEIDSTKIRKMIKDDENIKSLLNKNVYEYIKKNRLYE